MLGAHGESIRRDGGLSASREGKRLALDPELPPGFTNRSLEPLPVIVYNVVIMSEILGAFEQAVLLTLVRLGAAAYGRAILKDVQGRLEREVSAGAVYATLERLEHKALISSRLAAGTPARGGRARRYYSVEAAGIRALDESKAVLDGLWRGLAWPLGGR
jgi:PadR family transcriptional regulator